MHVMAQPLQAVARTNEHDYAHRRAVACTAYRGQLPSTNTCSDSPRSRADGVTIVLSPTRIFRPLRIAARTSSSQTNSAGLSPRAVVSALWFEGDTEEVGSVGRYPRDARKLSILDASA